MQNSQASKSISHSFWSVSEKELFAQLGSSANGLSAKEAKERLEQNGSNEVKQGKRRELIELLLAQFKNPLVFVLIIAALIAFFLSDPIEAGVIFLIVIVNTVLGFTQEYRAEKALVELRKYLKINASVLRDGAKVELDSRELVLGDIVHLRIGDIVPADLRLLSSEEFSANESSLTGESNPVEKKPGLVDAKYSLPQQLTNMAFMGTSAASGSAYGIVVATGEKTIFGRTVKTIGEVPVEDNFQKSIASFSALLLKVIVLMVIFIFLSNAFLGKGIFESFLFAIALAVGITPEALPMIITMTLSMNALKMAKNKVVVKKLDALEDLGNMDTLCSDKTGTLTEGKLRMVGFVDLEGKKDEEMVLLGMLCNSAERTRGIAFGNPIDTAILESREAKRLGRKAGEFRLIDENEFDFERKRMSVIVKGRGGALLIAKGAPEHMLRVCTSAKINGQNRGLDKKLADALGEKIVSYESEGFNVIAVASRKVFGVKKGADLGAKAERGLCLLGFLLFLDPPKKTAKDAVALLKRLDVRLKLITGDSPVIARKICGEVGLEINEGRVVGGEELSALNEKDFEDYCGKYNVFARVTPEQKYKIVLSLNKEGHIVGFLGDGINDAPALKAADVGISVDTASGIAKESADIILLQKNLHVLATGIVGGRKAFGNVTKYVLNATSSNYGNMFTVAISSLFLNFIPLLPSQILLENLLSDVPSLTISTDHVDEEMLKKPRRWNNKFILEFMVYFGLLSVVFDLIMIGALLFIFNSSESQFRTAWFVESLLSEVAVSLSIRTRRPVFKSKPGKLFFWASVGACLFGLLLAFSYIGNIFFSFEPVPANIMLLTLGVIAVYFASVEIMKHYFFRKFDL